jgi:hypothetical protein
MDGLRNPIGEEPPEVYWKRRLVAAIALVLVIVVIWVLIAAATGGDDGDSTPGSNAEPASSISASADATDSTDSSVRACGESDLTITTTANPATVPEGALPAFDVSLAQDGSSACLLDTDADGTELLITSGTDRMFSSLDCPDDGTIASTQLVLEPGATEDLSVTWNRQRTLPECATETAEPGAGTYKAALTIQGITSEVATFKLG